MQRKAFVSVNGQAGQTYDDVSQPVVSPDGKHLLYVATKGRGERRKQIVVLDGQAGPDYDEIAMPSSGVLNAFSPDGKRTCYAARIGLRWRAVLDGKPGEQYDDIAADTLAFSPDGLYVAYAAKQNGKWHVVCDINSESEFDRIDNAPIQFNDMDQPVYAALAAGKWHIVNLGRRSKDFDEIAGLAVGPGGKIIAFAARDGDKWSAFGNHLGTGGHSQVGLDDGEKFWFSKDGARAAYAAKSADGWHVVTDDKKGPAYDEVRLADSSFFSPDGKHTAYLARKGAQWAVVLDGKAEPFYSEIAPWSFEFGKDGERTAYVARRGEKWVMVIDGKLSQEYDEVDASSRVFTVGGQRTAYMARHDGKWRIVIDGNEGAAYDDVSEIIYSPDGGRMAYVATEVVGGDEPARKQTLVIDGQAGPGHEFIGTYFFCGRPVHLTSATYPTGILRGKFPLGHNNLFQVVFSADGKHVAYTIRDKDASAVVRDGEAGPKYLSVAAPMFSPDGVRLACAAMQGTSEMPRYCMVVDGQEGKSFEEIRTPRGGLSCFTPDDKHVVYAVRHGVQWSVVHDGLEGPLCDTFFAPASVTAYDRPAAYASWQSASWQRDKEDMLRPRYDWVVFQPVFRAGDAIYVGVVDSRVASTVVVGTRAEKQYGQISTLAASRDGKQVSYIACREDGDKRKFMAVIDGREGPEFDQISWEEWGLFGVNGRRTAYMGRLGETWQVVIDEKPGTQYDHVLSAAVGISGGFISPDGKRTAYLAKKGATWRAVIDGVEGPQFQNVGNGQCLVVFSPDCKRTAYIMGKGSGEWQAVIDGQASPVYVLKWCSSPIFSPDSKHIAYLGGREGKQFLVLDGKELSPYESVDGLRIQFSPDSKRVAYVAFRGEEKVRKAHVVLDGKDEPEFGDVIWHTSFSPDGKHFAYIAINGRYQDHEHTEQVIVDGKPGPAFSNVSTGSPWIQWGADGARHAYIGSLASHTEAVVVDAQIGPVFQWFLDWGFSPDGKSVAYCGYGVGDDPGYMLVRDGRCGPQFTEIERLPHAGGMFTPDSRHVVYKGKLGGNSVIVVDDQPGPEYDGVLSTCFAISAYGDPSEMSSAMATYRFSPDGAVQYPAYKVGEGGKSGDLYIVTHWPPAAATATAPSSRPSGDTGNGK